jgi:uncharacterized protein YndB with AHSA1/START domain
MAESRFVYVTYIRTTPQRPWQALLDPEFTRRYWVGTWHESEWNPGAPWRLMIPDGRVGHCGEVLEIEPPRRLALVWRAEFLPELRAEGYSRVTFELEPRGESVKLTVVHEIGKPDSKLVKTLSSGWPHLLPASRASSKRGSRLPRPAAGRSRPKRPAAGRRASNRRKGEAMKSLNPGHGYLHNRGGLFVAGVRGLPPTVRDLLCQEATG